MELYNTIILTDVNYTILNISRTDNDKLNNGNNKFIGKNILSYIDIDLNHRNGTTVFNNLPLKYNIISHESFDGFIIHLSNSIYYNTFYQQILDILDLGIHITDRSGYISFTNKAAEKGEFLNRRLTTGKHISDIYPLTSKTSCILRALNSKKPLLNIYDTFKNNYSTQTISSINSGYPIFINDILVAGLSVVRFNNYLTKATKELKNLNKFVQDGGTLTQKIYKDNLFYTFDNLIGKNKDFLDSVNLAKRVAQTDSSILLYGETGTGKELFAQSIHSASNRRNNEFVAINCAAIPEGLIESTLFGTEKGSFTSSMNKPGLLEKANNGTLFLDEVNSMSPNMQAKLLRFLQEKKYMKVGGVKSIPCDVRVISSTNEAPESVLSSGKIRSDLYYRINTITIPIPPLRQRKEDIIVLYNYFIHKISCPNNYKTSKSVKKILLSYDWPGNIRELLHTVEYAITVCEDSYITTRDIPQNIIKYNYSKTASKEKNGMDLSANNFKNSLDNSNLSSNTSLHDLMKNYEKQIIFKALKKNNFNISQTAKSLNLHRQALQYRIKRHNLSELVSHISKDIKKEVD